MDVLRELAGLHGEDLQRAGHFHRTVDAGELVGVIGVDDQRVEAQEFREPIAIDRKAGGRQCGRAQRADIDPGPCLAQPLGVAGKHGTHREQVVGIRGGLRLNAVREGRDDRTRVAFRDGEHRFARRAQCVDLAQQAVAQVHPRQRRREVLPAASGVQSRGLRAADLDQPGFVVEVVGGRPRRCLGIACAQLGDGACDAPAGVGRQHARLDQCDQRGSVDLVEELDRAAATAERLIQVAAHRDGFSRDLAMHPPLRARRIMPLPSRPHSHYPRPFRAIRRLGRPTRPGTTRIHLEEERFDGDPRLDSIRLQRGPAPAAPDDGWYG